MKRSMIAVVGVVAMMLAAGSVQADIRIDVIPSSAPNGHGSSSWGGYEANAIHAIENGLTSYGNPALPTYYQVAPASMPISNNVVTGFASWQGIADPSGAFAGEVGTRLHFGLHILGNNGTQFSISQLSFVGTSSDPGNTLGFSYLAGVDGYDYGSGYVGINYGFNGVKGGGDDIIITSGASTQLVDELVSRGSGNAWDAYAVSPGATNQDKIDRIQNGLWRDTGWGSGPDGPDYNLRPAPFDFTGTYTLGAQSASATVSLTPEPATMALLAVGGIATLLRRKRSSKK